MKMNNKIEYFEEDDFELIFNTLNLFHEEAIPIQYLFKGLQMIGCKYDESHIITKYKLTETRVVTKKQFIKAMKREYGKMITIDLN